MGPGRTTVEQEVGGYNGSESGQIGIASWATCILDRWSRRIGYSGGIEFAGGFPYQSYDGNASFVDWGRPGIELGAPASERTASCPYGTATTTTGSARRI